MFIYVNTLTKLNYGPHEINLLMQHVDYYLISLIDGLRQSSFGLDTLVKTANSIEKLHKKFPKKKWMIDSGGYSIIVGDVSPRDMSKFMECYCYYLEEYAPKNCDYILSLDIPILLKYPEYNTVKFIKDMNYASCSRSKDILDKNLDLYEKFVFVWQFKTPKQYQIWNELYKDIFDDAPIRHYAVGGQVGLRGITGINFSPFIGSCYQIMDLIVNKKNIKNHSHIIHLLGIYGLHDRFLMGIFDRLFNIYLKGQDSVKITFDTVNHMISGLYKIRELKSVILQENNVIYDYNHLLIDKFHLLINNEDTLKNVQENLQCILEDKKIDDTSVIATLEVVKNQIFNIIMDGAIEHYGIVDMFLDSENYNKFKNRFRPVYLKMEKDFPYVFGNRLNKVLLNFQYVYAFHTWWQQGRDPKRLQDMMSKFIKLIDFPADLAA